jgi:hypothetical protein
MTRRQCQPIQLCGPLVRSKKKQEKRFQQQEKKTHLNSFFFLLFRIAKSDSVARRRTLHAGPT